MTLDPLPDDEPAPDAEPPFLAIYVASCKKHLVRMSEALDQLRRTPSDAGALEVLHRGFHSLHGNSSFLPECPITPLAQAGEAALKAARKGRVDPQLLLESLGAAISRCAARVEEYRRQGAAGPPAPREVELASSILALARGIARTGDAGRAQPSGPRYVYGGHDVTAILELLGQYDEPARGERRDQDGLEALAQAHDELRRQAQALRDRELLELLDSGDAQPRILLRLLAQRIKHIDATNADPQPSTRAGRRGITRRTSA